jgi:CBS domain containing-hemolysin-like protein
MDRLTEREYIFSARMDLDDINDEMDIELPTGDSDTIGGLVYNSLGRIPQKGDVINGSVFGEPDIRLTVLAVDGRRIERVKVERLIPDETLNDGEENLVGDDGRSRFLQKPQNSVSNT